MSSLTRTRRSSAGRFWLAGVAGLATLGLLLGEPAGPGSTVIGEGIRSCVSFVTDSGAQCWQSVIHVCDVAAGSFRLLARIGREVSPPPACSYDSGTGRPASHGTLLA